MQIRKMTTIEAVDSNGEVMELGSTYAFDIEEGKCLVGVYRGITKRGALIFESVISGALVTFNIMPKSILRIEKVEVNNI